MRVFRASLVLMSLLAPLAPGAARAAAPVGNRCGFSYVPDLDYHDGDPQQSEIDGGPLVVTDAAGLPVLAKLTCALRLSATGVRYADPAAASATGPEALGVVDVPPSVVSFQADILDAPWVCTQVDVTGGPSYYWDEVAREWTTDPDTYCASPYGPMPDPFPFVVVDKVIEYEAEYVDPVICPVLAVAFPPEGDVPDLWDCPPYGNV